MASVQSTYRRVFETILKLIDFPDLDKQFVFNKGGEYDLYKPDSKACYSVVWMYTLEPPLYEMLNKAMRNENRAYIDMLGPFAQAVSYALAKAERRRNSECLP